VGSPGVGEGTRPPLSVITRKGACRPPDARSEERVLGPGALGSVIMHEPDEEAKVACECGLQREWPLHWAHRPQLPLIREEWEGQLICRGDWYPIKEAFRLHVPAGSQVWDSRVFCSACVNHISTPGCTADPVGLHYTAEHVFLATGEGRRWLTDSPIPYVLPSISNTRDTVLALKAPGRTLTASSEVIREHQEGVQQEPRDTGISTAVYDTFTVFKRHDAGVGHDVSTTQRIDDMVGPQAAPLAACLSGSQCRTRVEGLYWYGPHLSEVVCPRSALEGPVPGLERIKTVEYSTLPAWVRWAIDRQEVYRYGLCSPRRRAVRDTVLSWILQPTSTP
jgi:hypothetical protein